MLSSSADETNDDDLPSKAKLTTGKCIILEKSTSKSFMMSFESTN